MIYYMPIDECPTCGARTPRIVRHRCPKQEDNTGIGDKLAAEFQTWIASQMVAASVRPEATTSAEEREIRSRQVNPDPSVLQPGGAFTGE
jgi:hypothetical protein